MCTDLEIAVSDITPNHLDNLCTILIHLAPMLDGIRSLDCSCSAESAFLMVKEHFFRENEKLAKLKRLDVHFECETGFFRHSKNTIEQQVNVDFIMNWLALPDTDGPRLFEFTSDSNAFYEQILKAIREVV